MVILAEEHLVMPNASQGQPPITEVVHDGVVVVVGANGAGKSRLGAWLEAPDNLSATPNYNPPSARLAHRVSAQRFLNLPATAGRFSVAETERQFRLGMDAGLERSTRLHGDPVVGQMADFQSLVNYLFAEETGSALQYKAQGVASGGNPGLPPETTLERVKRIWESIFTERELAFGDHTISARLRGGGPEYPASNMSDGERVGFYLIGEVLLATHDLQVVDEPELHVHESIQAALWDALEAARPDCSFVYITHDLSFAATRVGAPKVVLYDYEPSSPNGDWKWDCVPANTGLPEDVVLRIAGSRRPTVFTEGLRGSLDEEIFGTVYPQFHIVPSENCENVIRAVRAFQGQGGLHRYEVRGIVDRDDRESDEIAGLSAVGVHVLPVAGVENLLVLPEVLEAVADHLHIAGTDRVTLLTHAKWRVVEHLRSRRKETIAQRAQYNVERRLHHITRAGSSRQHLVDAVQAAFAAADPGGAYEEATALIDSALNATGDPAYELTLTVYRNKGLIPAVAQVFGLRVDVYSRIAIALLRDPMNPLMGKVRQRLPSLA